MAVKNGLPATDFSKMNRDYIRNVAEGETVKDGLPATDLSRMNRKYIKAVVEEAGGGGGGSSDFGTATITLNLTPPEGVTLTMYDLSGAKMPFHGFFFEPTGDFGAISSEGNTITVPLGKNEDSGTLQFRFETFDGTDSEFDSYIPDGTVTLSGAIELIAAAESPYYLVTGDCSITCNVDRGK